MRDIAQKEQTANETSRHIRAQTPKGKGQRKTGQCMYYSNQHMKYTRIIAKEQINQI